MNEEIGNIKNTFSRERRLDKDSSVVDEYGVAYSKDGKRLLMCTNKTIRRYTIKDGTEEIKEYAFKECATLEVIIIPSSLTLIKFCAFQDCTSLLKVTIPKSVATIEWCAFDGCKSIVSFSVEAGNKCFCSIDGVLYTKDMTTLWQYPCNAPSTSFNIPEGIKIISRDAFSNCSRLTEITIPESVSEIGDSAFSDCTSLVRVNYNAIDCFVDSETPIFWNCNKLSEIVIGDRITELSSSLFCSCFGLTEVVIPDNVKIIGGATFCNCKNLKRVHIPYGVTMIDNYAFESCINLTDIIIPCSVKEIGLFAFAKCSNLEHLNIPSSVEKIGKCAFSPMSPNKLEMEDDNAHYCVKDGVLYSKDMTTLIAFPSLSKHTSFTIPGTVTTIAGRAFDLCKNLISIILPPQLTYIGMFAFAYCENIVSIILPETITEIGDGAFARCSNLKTIISLNPQPPKCYSIFDLDLIYDGEASMYYQQCTIKVPRESKELYANSKGWKDFKSIEAIG